MNTGLNTIKKIKLIIIENNGCLSNPVSTINHKGDIVQTFNMLDILAIQDVPKNYQVCIISNNSILFGIKMLFLFETISSIK